MTAVHTLQPLRKYFHTGNTGQLYFKVTNCHDTIAIMTVFQGCRVTSTARIKNASVTAVLLNIVFMVFNFYNLTSNYKNIKTHKTHCLRTTASTYDTYSSH